MRFALLEMATGLPYIVTNVGDLPLMVLDGLDGIVIPVGDAEVLSTAIRYRVHAKEYASVGPWARSRTFLNKMHVNPERLNCSSLC